ncbi:MAG: universal stress protein [Psychrobacter sp.]|nr:universal stress protein [Psychrobacter sp.]
MSNLKPDSVIACLDHPDHVQAVLDASIWAATKLQAPIGLLHAVPSVHKNNAVNYSGCLTIDDESHLLDQFISQERLSNSQLNAQGRVLLSQADSYCQQRARKLTMYSLHRHERLADSLSYVDETAQLIVIGRKVTCRTTLSELIRPSLCPILVTDAPFLTPSSALFAFDNRATCHRLLDWLCQNPLARTLSLHIVMVGKETTENVDALREAYARLKQAGIDCKKALIDSRDVSAAILYYQQQHEISLLMTGAFGQSRLRELFQGSDTERLLGGTQTPYLLFPKE